MAEDTLLPFDLPAVSRKKVTADFGGGLISSDGGLVLLRAAEQRLGLAEVLAGCIREWRDPERVVHTPPAMLRVRMFPIPPSPTLRLLPSLVRSTPVRRTSPNRVFGSARTLRKTCPRHLPSRRNFHPVAVGNSIVSPMPNLLPHSRQSGCLRGTTF